MNNSLFKLNNRTSLLICTTLISSAALATSDKELDTIVVTATRTAQTVDQTLAAVTIITRKDIERSQPNTLIDLLRTQTGIHISRTGGAGKTTSVFIRGTNNKHALVLIDGVRASSATLGQFAWNTLSPEQIERIEIVRGPRASLYGSDTIGGVIHIFTRNNQKTTAKLTTGSDNTYGIDVGTGGGERWHYSVSAGRQLTDGIPNHEAVTEDNGVTTSYGTLRIGIPLSNTLQLDTSANQSQTNITNDTNTGDSITTNRIFNLQLKHQLSSNWFHKLSLGQTLDQSRSLSVYYPSTITTRRDSASWQHDIELASGLLSVGIDAWEDHATKDDSGVIDERIDNRAAFLEYQFSLHGNDFQLGARTDDHSSFGTRDSWNIAWGRQFNKLRLTGSYGTAFNAPSINDLYWPYSSGVYFGTTYITQGNTSLKPETSDSAEIGLRYQLSENTLVKANLYKTRIRQMINWNSVQTGATEWTTQPDNINSATIDGLELEAQHQYGPWSTSANLNFLNAIDNSTRQQLDRRPRRTLNLNISRDTGFGRFHSEVVISSARNDVSAAYQSGGYGVVNLMYEKKITADTKLQARIDNLFDKTYTLARNSTGNYNTYDRSLYLSLLYSPDK